MSKVSPLNWLTEAILGIVDYKNIQPNTFFMENPINWMEDHYS